MFEEEVDVKWATLFFFLFVFLPNQKKKEKKRKEKKERKVRMIKRKSFFGLSANDIFLVWVSIPHFRVIKKKTQEALNHF